MTTTTTTMMTLGVAPLLSLQRAAPVALYSAGLTLGTGLTTARIDTNAEEEAEWIACPKKALYKTATVLIL